MRDNDKIYGHTFKQMLASIGIEDIHTSPHSPWQNPYVERMIGTTRRECLDHLIILNEDHLYQILSDYVRYYNEARCHESLDDNSPMPREKESGRGRVESIPYLGGLHHRYTRQAA